MSEDVLRLDPEAGEEGEDVIVIITYLVGLGGFPHFLAGREWLVRQSENSVGTSRHAVIRDSIQQKGIGSATTVRPGRRDANALTSRGSP